MKTCTKCEKTKEFTEFTKRKAGKDGLNSYCRSCLKAVNNSRKEYRAEYYKKNKKEILAKQKESRLKNPEYMKNYMKKYYEQNKSTMNTYSIEWQKANRELHNSYVKNWKKNNLGKIRYYSSKYRKEIKNSSTFLTQKELNLMLEFYVNCPEGYQVDHIIPIAKGGLHCLNNLQYLSNFDNQSKGSKLPSEWADPRPIKCIPFLSCNLS